jgi:hypothetical protein
MSMSGQPDRIETGFVEGYHFYIVSDSKRPEFNLKISIGYEIPDELGGVL